MAAPDKWTQKLLTWLETQPADYQARIKGMLEKGLVNEVKAELPKGWASTVPSTKTKATTPEAKPAEPKPKKETKPKAESKPKAETKAATPEAKPTTEPAKTEAPKTEKPSDKKPAKVKPTAKSPGLMQEVKNLGKVTKKGIGKVLDTPVGKYIRNNKIQTGAVGLTGGIPLIERALEVKKDMSGGQSFTEALNKPGSNTKLARAEANAMLAGLGAKLGGATLGRVGAPVIGTTIGAAALPYLGNKAMDAMGILKEPEAPAQSPVETQPAAPVEQGRDWDEGELDKLFEADRQTEELKQRQQDAVDQAPNPILEQERRAAQAADVSSASMGPSSKPPGMYNEPPSDFNDIFSPENPDENFNRLLQMQEYARSNPAANLRKKRIMQAGLDAVETGTFRARRPDRYTIVV